MKAHLCSPREQAELNAAHQAIGAPVPGMDEPAPYQRGEDSSSTRIPFEELSAMFRMAVDHVNKDLAAKQAA